jgi:hypothetical protein
MKRDIQKVNDDIIEMKRLIKQKLISDPDILEALNNPEIDLDSPDEFLDNNIYGFIRVPKTQDTVRNFICFTVDDIEADRFNEVMKTQYIQFNCICHLEDMKTEFGIDRHDLLGYLVRDTFNWSDDFGSQFKLVYNKESTIDSDYYCRTLKFESTQVNSLNKARAYNPYDKFRSR